MMDRRHNDPQSPHERARLLASDQLDGPLAAADLAWLTDHLAACPACNEIAAAYAADRDLLRAMPIPEPPRDLWARTSVAISRERAAALGSGAARSRQRVRWESLAGVLAVLVVGAVVGRTLLGPFSNGVQPGSSGPLPSTAGATFAAGATPIAVAAGDVAWAAPGANGSYTLQVTSVTSVCPSDAAPAPDCAPLTGAQQLLTLSKRPGSVAIAPKAGQAAVVDSSASTTGGSIVIVSIQRSSPPPTPSLGASPTSSAGPTASATPSATPTVGPTSQPSVTPTEKPSATPEQSAPTSPTTSPGPTVAPSASPSATPIPSGTPAPTAAGMLAIINDVIVVGSDAAYSADGDWLAFSARPADGSQGPDVYVWHAGDVAGSARAITTDHASVFSDWVDGRILASRAIPSPTVTTDAQASASPAPRTAAAVSMLLDPDTGKVHGSTTMTGVWRPVVDPTGRWAAYWKGSLVLDPTSGAFIPDQGSLVLADWQKLIAGDPASVVDTRPLVDPQPSGPVRDWEVRWDPTGGYLGVWVGDPLVAGLGRLELVTIDRSTGGLDPDHHSLLRDAAALSGFAVGDGRIVWATPPGQDGQGSRLFLLAWKGKDAGQLKSLPAPSEEDIVVAR